MKILILGDLHGSKKIKKIDFKNIELILCPGDIGKANLARKKAFQDVNRRKKGLKELELTKEKAKKSYMEVYNSTIDLLTFLSKKASAYFVYGNVEWSDKEIKKHSKENKIRLPLIEQKIKKLKNVKILNNKKTKKKGLIIGGIEYFLETEWVKTFDQNNKKRMKIAKKQTQKAKNTLSKLGKVDILLCHQPPYGILDKVNFPSAPKHWQNKHAGSKEILKYIKKHKPRLVICGHIHEGKGEKSLGKTKIINAGCCGDYSTIELE